VESGDDISAAGSDPPLSQLPTRVTLSRCAGSRSHSFRPMIPEIDIWRAALVMLKRFGDNARKESAAHSA
jgi:hypothetical protein